MCYVLDVGPSKRSGTPNGIRTRAATLKGWCPRPLDDGGLGTRLDESGATLTGLPAVSTRSLVGHLSVPRFRRLRGCEKWR